MPPDINHTETPESRVANPTGSEVQNGSGVVGADLCRPESAELLSMGRKLDHRYQCRRHPNKYCLVPKQGFFSFLVLTALKPEKTRIP